MSRSWGESDRDGRDSARPDRRVFSHVVLHNGLTYRTTEEMAGIFLRRAALLVRSAETELLPLSHAAGVDLLPVAPETVWSVTAVPADIPRREPAAAPAARRLRAVS